jgi:mycothiol system anti-sigma-R factor
MTIKKKCAEAHLQVYEYLDDEIGWYRRWRIRKHLRACPPCEDGFIFEDKLKSRIRRGATDDIPRELLDRIRSSYRQDGTDDPVDSTGGG